VQQTITILHVDEAIAVVAKRTGVPTQPDRSGDASALELAERSVGGRLYVVHRIDRPASGLVVFARSSDAAGALSRAIQAGRVARRYWAIVEGHPDDDRGEIDTGIVFDRRTNRSRVVPTGKRARLRYAVLARGERYTLVQVALQTGRHHQIRAQLAHAVSPIRGDVKYGARRTLPGGGIALHAVGLRFPHPLTGKPFTCVAPPPADRLWEALLAAAPAGSPFSDP